jgi:mRNA interferase MazF
VIVSCRAHNLARPDVVIMAITSQLHSVADGTGDWKPAPLLKSSAIKPVLATVEQGLILKQLGAREAADQARFGRRFPMC